MQIFSTVFVIIGIIIGAGFASGKEIYTFFFVYGEKGVIGIIISITIISYMIYKSLKTAKKYNINSYSELLNKAITKKRKIDIELVINFIINLFLLISFFVMCAGFSAYFKQEYEINKIYSSIFIAILSFIILNKDMKGIVILNWILIPVIIIFLGILGIKSSNLVEGIKVGVDSEIWLLQAILYASYNSITLISMLIPMKKYVKSNKDILKISVLVGIIIGALALIIIMLLLTINEDISQIELPAVYASR